MRRTTQQNKRKRDTNYRPEMHAKDVNSREIFKNDKLTSQFLRNYTNIPIFANVQPEDYEKFRNISEELIDSIYGNAPEEIKEIYKNVLWSLLMKMNVPTEEAKKLMGEIGGRGMGYLFENMEKMDIQAERRNTQREKERADMAERKVDEANSRADRAERKVDEANSRADKAEKEKRQIELEFLRLKQELAKHQNVTENK